MKCTVMIDGAHVKSRITVPDLSGASYTLHPYFVTLFPYSEINGQFIGRPFDAEFEPGESAKAVCAPAVCKIAGWPSRALGRFQDTAVQIPATTRPSFRLHLTR